MSAVAVRATPASSLEAALDIALGYTPDRKFGRGSTILVKLNEDAYRLTVLDAADGVLWRGELPWDVVRELRL